MVEAINSILPPGPRLAGRKIIVTGAASGMGKAIAELFTAEGATLTLLDIQAEPLAAVAKATGSKAVTLDISDEAEIAGAVEAANTFMGGIDGVVNAAGILRALPLEQTSPDIWRKIHNVNLFAPFLLSNAALPYLRAAAEATIVNISSKGGIDTPPMMASYGASKAGLIALTKGQATEWSPQIRVNVICPGVIRTPMTDAISVEGDNDVMSLNSGARRRGTPLEVAYLALFLTGRESSFISGAVYVCDGGPPMPYNLSQK
jgi:NAD(P)-dependent dehydrogenase (short-subunit alcohol dehydrogenase family)